MTSEYHVFVLTDPLLYSRVVARERVVRAEAEAAITVTGPPDQAGPRCCCVHAGLAPLARSE